MVEKMDLIKVGVISLGCAKNTVDTEMMLGILDKTGEFLFVQDLEDAQVVIVNTCGFINDAKKESIDTIFEVAQYKEQFNLKGVVVTGCLSKRYKELLFDQIPEADVFLGTENYHSITKAVKCAFNGERAMFFDDENIDYEVEERVITTFPHTAYIKISEGCDNKCTYCAIPLIRGPYRSRTMESIIKEAEYLSANGVKEIILIAQDTTKYGMDIYGKKSLVKLLQEVSKLDAVEWVRVLYSYPEDITDELLSEIYNNEKICNYIDMPLQHFSDNILTRMNRKSDHNGIKLLVEKIRKDYPDMTLRTTLMVGFPGEDQQDYELLKESVKKIEFDRLGVFAFSKEEDTVAFLLDETVSEETKQDRKEEIMQIQQEISYKLNQQKIDKVYKVLIDEYDESIFMYIGRSEQFAPDSDGSIYISSEKPLLLGEYYNVKIVKSEFHDLMGECI